MRVYLGLLGLYRSFEQTSTKLFEYLIDNNPQCNFDIYINTQYDEGYEHDKWKNTQIQKKYDKKELDILFKKHYKSNLKNITYLTITKIDSFSRYKNMITDIIDNNRKYDIYLFMRIDCVFEKKIDFYNYTTKLDNNVIKLICGGPVNPKRMDHDRDCDYGIISKNIYNCKKYVTHNFKYLNPTIDELIKMSKIIKNKSIITRYDKLPPRIEMEFRRHPHARGYISRIYSFNKTLGPLLFEDIFFLKIIRPPYLKLSQSKYFYLKDLKRHLINFRKIFIIIIFIFIVWIVWKYRYILTKYNFKKNVKYIKK